MSDISMIVVFLIRNDQYFVLFFQQTVHYCPLVLYYWTLNYYFDFRFFFFTVSEHACINEEYRLYIDMHLKSI